jgi:hypothetical protein
VKIILTAVGNNVIPVIEILSNHCDGRLILATKDAEKMVALDSAMGKG